MRRAVLALLALSALAGCGSHDVRDPARVLPASTRALVRLDRGPQLAAAGRMLGAVSGLPAALRAAEEASGLPAGSGRAYLAALPDGWVALVRPRDPKAFAARLGLLPTARVGGWTVVGRTQAAVDAVRHARGRLTLRIGYRQPPRDGPAAVWAAPSGARLLALPRQRGLRWSTATLAPDRLTVRQRCASPGPSVSSAVADATEGAVFAVGLGPWAPVARVLPAFAAAYGFDVGAAAGALPTGSAVIVRAGVLIPELTLAGESPAAATAAHRLGELLVRHATSAQPATLDGVPLERFSLGAGEVDDGAWGSRFAASTGSAGVLAARGGGADLGLPAETQGWVLVDRARAAPVAAAFDALAGGRRARAALARLGPSGRLLAWESRRAGVETTVVDARGR